MKKIVHIPGIFIFAAFLWSVPLGLCDNADSNITQDQHCGLLNCHGLDVQCGFNPPEVCDAMYRMGDFCRQYISCTIAEGKCQTVVSPNFQQCRSCVEGCHKQESDPAQSFACEDKCRKLFE